MPLFWSYQFFVCCIGNFLVITLLLTPKRLCDDEVCLTGGGSLGMRSTAIVYPTCHETMSSLLTLSLIFKDVWFDLPLEVHLLKSIMDITHVKRTSSVLHISR
ncbi:hypothetical protein VNO77_16315 [Canavalia gladiata]|uniref:Uncharacterized protein n=1 Tax=Canavalia gladiata TaxID=3824 RepID=A0AAN9M070_CANGL